MKNNYILGTAQLGMPYGIANTSGQPSLEYAQNIVRTALENNVFHFDTAQVYGVSEKVLGQCLKLLNVQAKAKIITKVTAENLQKQEFLEKALTNSLQNFEANSLYCFMLHHEEYLAYLDAWQGDYLKDMQDKDIIEKIGISVYDPQKAIEALNHKRVQVVQVPSSLLDRRFVDIGVFELAKKLGKEIHIRSVFLQGVLCMPVENLPNYLLPLKQSVESFHALCQEYVCTPSQAALAYMQFKEPESFLIFGVDNSNQVKENMSKDWQQTVDIQKFLDELDAIQVPQQAKLLNPALWEK